jgi:hypothetical protein
MYPLLMDHGPVSVPPRHVIERVATRALSHALRGDDPVTAAQELVELAGGNGWVLRLALQRIDYRHEPGRRATAADRAAESLRLAIDRVAGPDRLAGGA